MQETMVGFTLGTPGTDVENPTEGDRQEVGSSELPANGKEEEEDNLRASERPNRQNLHRRKPSRTDLVTGKILDDEERGVMARALSTTDAMGAVARRRSNFKKALSPLTTKKKRLRHDNRVDDNDSIYPSVHGRLTVQPSQSAADIEEEDEESGSEASRRIQYRLTARKPREGRLFRLLGYIGISVGADAIYEDAGDENSGLLCCGVSPNYLANQFINYLFRASFLRVLFIGAVGFYILTLAFALLIFASGNNNPECIHVNGQYFGESGDGNRFYDAYMLSWTTFSTVGYGLVFPSTSGTAESNYKKCVGIQLLCTFESFVGILFGSFCGAIVFGKVARARSVASVAFSDPIVVRYGRGVREEVSDDSSSDEDEEEDMSSLPCPILEFRVINRMHSTPGGELMDASFNAVAAIEETQACMAAKCEKEMRKGKIRRRPSADARGRIPLSLPEKESLHPGHPDDSEPAVSPFAVSKSLQAIDEDLDEEEENRRVFAKLKLETPDHPFFKRTWAARHVLNADSPLLRPEARRRIADNNGFWPAEMNNYLATRESILFDQILVSLSGTSNAGANSVYAQKVYDFVDMNVGYRFANVLYRDPRDGTVRVDPTIINDVLEQVGGGAEPLTASDQEQAIPVALTM